MELKRRRKKEETTSTENKIAQMKVAAESVRSSADRSLFQKEIHQAEEWSRKKEYWRQTVMPFCVGLLVCAAGYYNLR
jgi:hypothetical protein